MAQRLFRSDDTSVWPERYGTGADGPLVVSGNTTFSEANAGFSGTASSTSGTLDNASTFANNDLVLIHQSRGTGVGLMELNKIASGGGTTSVTLAYPLINTYTDSGASQAQILKLRQYSSVTVNSGITLSAPSWDGNKGGILAYLCNGLTSVVGTITATGKGYRGGISTTGSHGGYGESSIADRSASTTKFNNDTGGGGGGEGSVDADAGGGGGGHGTVGLIGEGINGRDAGFGGTTSGTAGMLSPMFGGAGGAGGANVGEATYSGCSGGGLIFIISKYLTVTGAITNDGDSGLQNTGNDDGMPGGGAGGSTILKSQILTLGSSLVTAAAGLGGTTPIGAGPGDTQGGGGNGGDGVVGRIHADYLVSASGSTSPAIDLRQDPTIYDATGGSFIFSLM